MASSKHHIPLFETGFFAALLDLEHRPAPRSPPVVVRSDSERVLLRQAVGELRLSLAVQYIRDASVRRPVQPLPHSLSQRRAERIYGSWVYEGLFLLFVFLWVITAPFDDALPKEKRYHVSTVGIVLVGFDVILGVFAYSPARYFARLRNFNYALLWAALWINDLTTSLGYNGFPLRHFVQGCRVLLPIFKSSSLRLALGGLVKTLPRVWQVLVIYMTVTTLWALVGMEYFHMYYYDLDVEYTDCFSNFPRAWLSLFVLSTTENFPFVMYPPLFRLGGEMRSHTNQSSSSSDDSTDPTSSFSPTSSPSMGGAYSSSSSSYGGGYSGDSAYSSASMNDMASSSEPLESDSFQWGVRWPDPGSYENSMMNSGHGSDGSSNSYSSSGASESDYGNDGSWRKLIITQYPDDSMSTFTINVYHGLIITYFVSYLVLLVYLVLNMKLAAVYSSWQEVHEEQLKRSRLHMYHGLCCAFAVLTDDGSTALSLERHWQPLLLRLRPELTPQQVVDLFNFLNDDASSGVELKEWVLRGVDALTFDFTTHEVGSDHFLAAIAECADLDAANAVAAANSISSPESTSNAPGYDNQQQPQSPAATRAAAAATAASATATAEARTAKAAALAANGPRGDLMWPSVQEICGKLMGRVYFFLATASRACCDLLCCEKGMLAEYEHSGSFSNGSFNESVNGPINSHGAPHTTSNGYANVSGYENGYSNGHGNYDGFSSGNLGNNDNCVLVPWAVRQWTFAHVVNQSAFFWTVQLSIAVHVLLLIAAPWPYTPAAEGLQNTVLAIALAELVLKAICLPGWKHRTAAMRFDVLACITLLVAQCLPLFYAAFSHQSINPTGSLLKAQLCLRGVGLGKLFTQGRGVRDVIGTVARIRSILVLFVAVYGIIIYLYASGAQDLFAGVLPRKFKYDVDDPTGPDDDVLNALVTLGSFEQASLQLFQIAMTNNWQDIMYANVLSPYDVSNLHRVAMAAFFVSFFFCMVWLGTNVLTALVIDVYVVALSRSNELQTKRAAIARALMEITTSHFNNGGNMSPQQHSTQQPQAYHQMWQQQEQREQQQLQQQTFSNDLINDNTCSRCAASGHMCRAIYPSPASNVNGSTTPTGVCAECGHGFMYHSTNSNAGSGVGYGNNGSSSLSNNHIGSGHFVPSQDRKEDDVRSNSSKSRGWGVLASAVRASKACKSSTKDAIKSKPGTAREPGKGLFYQPLVDSNDSRGVGSNVDDDGDYVGGNRGAHDRRSSLSHMKGSFYDNSGMLQGTTNNGGLNRLSFRDYDGGRQWQQQPLQHQEGGLRGSTVSDGPWESTKPGDSGVRDSAARQSAAAAWENLQLMSGLSLGDAVTVHASIDDDLLDPSLLEALRYRIARTCADLQQGQSSLHVAIRKRFSALCIKNAQAEGNARAIANLASGGLLSPQEDGRSRRNTSPGGQAPFLPSERGGGLHNSNSSGNNRYTFSSARTEHQQQQQQPLLPGYPSSNSRFEPRSSLHNHHAAKSSQRPAYFSPPPLTDIAASSERSISTSAVSSSSPPRPDDHPQDFYPGHRVSGRIRDGRL